MGSISMDRHWFSSFIDEMGEINIEPIGDLQMSFHVSFMLAKQEDGCLPWHPIL